MVILTESAVKAVSRFIENSEKNIAGLRIKVDGGGCSGFQYGLRLEDSISENDTVHEIGGIKMLIDKASEPLLQGVKVDFIDSMEGSGFKFENPNATASCGCGKSFSA
ncbi:HesB/IscA family protein [Sessilibacter sp. MAH2]